MIGGRRTMASNFEVHERMIRKKKSKEFFFIEKFKKYNSTINASNQNIPMGLPRSFTHHLI
jgi:hypothetical protein